MRDIDWNVTRRMGRPFVKRLREERELGVILAVDVSASSDFGSCRRTKREFAAEVAATLAFSAARNSDKVGLLLFTDRLELFLPPRKGRRHLLRIVREMLFFKPSGRATGIPAALASLNRLLHRRCIIFLLTDFLHCPDIEGATKGGPGRATVEGIGFTNVKHDLVCVHLLDPREKELPPAGLLTFEDAETGDLFEVDSGRPQVRAAYLDNNSKRSAALDRALRLVGVHTLRLTSGEPFAATLQTFFETRHRR